MSKVAMCHCVASVCVCLLMFVRAVISIAVLSSVIFMIIVLFSQIALCIWLFISLFVAGFVFRSMIV